ncbi:hypothetical protein EUTSA_v10002720mg [Eutrema salsugineum]|uniref:S-protein homolog n=1 Tax=Eutrema salsugineum TaxID=72664 RepID=V4LCC9_EUTSA|nr:S-protein homolog 9 [Eutrema salsugineum]ESQ37438.1 hypothetical protein EUTSA_v10002720mg [Eutrema salsugineum]
MNRIWCSLFIIALCIGWSNALKKNSVHFKNSLGQNNILRIHCTKDDDDLGYQQLSPGQTYDISFHDSLWGMRINCDLWQGLDYRFHAHFLAYEGGLIIPFVGKNNFWDAREDGIYFTHDILKVPTLKYKWV